MGQKQRYRQSRREGQVTENAENSAKTPLDDEIEVVESREEAVEASSEAQDGDKKPESEPIVVENEGEDPLEALRRQLEEVQAERDAEKRRAQEFENRSRQQQEALQRSQVNEIGHHKAVLEQAYAAEELKLREAKQRYASSLENQDFNSAAEAQLEMTRSDGVMRQYATAYQEIERTEKQPQQASYQAQADPFEAALATMDPRVAQWAREHKDDVIARQDVALAADRIAQAKGLKPGEDDYLDYLDGVMGYERSQPQVSAPKNSKRAPSAPVSRSSSGGSARRVYLTEDDKRTAKQLDMSEVEYAKFKLKAQEAITARGGFGRQMHFSGSTGRE